MPQEDESVLLFRFELPLARFVALVVGVDLFGHESGFRTRLSGSLGGPRLRVGPALG